MGEIINSRNIVYGAFPEWGSPIQPTFPDKVAVLIYTDDFVWPAAPLNPL